MAGIKDSIIEKRLQLFPKSTQIVRSSGISHLSIAGLDLSALVESYGTPLYLYDRATLDGAVQDYRQALSDCYPYKSRITYAGKAFLCTAFAQWTQIQDLWLDCTGVGELTIAAHAQVPSKNILVHGVSKTDIDLQAALLQAGTIVVDNLDELSRLTTLAEKLNLDLIPDLWLRLRPGVAVATHAYTQTGQDDSKFGMDPLEFLHAVQFCLLHKLPLKGLHFHQGSHFHDPSPLIPAIETALDLIVEVKTSLNWIPEVICPGGGWGVPYDEDDLPHATIKEYVNLVSMCILEGCRRRNLSMPMLQLEPGRSLIAQAGVSIYQVEAVKQTPHRTWLLLNGGMADNPRPALYGARYSCLPIDDLERPLTNLAWLAGPYCESGDILIQGLAMPEIGAGEFVAVPVSGAYHLSMGSNYNGARKPAVLWLEDGQVTIIQQRETLEDLVRRDYPLPCLQPPHL